MQKVAIAYHMGLHTGYYGKKIFKTLSTHNKWHNNKQVWIRSKY